MAQHLRELSILPKDLNLVPSSPFRSGRLTGPLTLILRASIPSSKLQKYLYSLSLSLGLSLSLSHTQN